MAPRQSHPAQNAMKHGYFITGTDTGVGKTRIATALLTAFNARGFSTAAMKPHWLRQHGTGFTQ